MSAAAVDLSDLPGDISETLREEIRTAREKRLEQEQRGADAQAALQTQLTLGQRYRAWALDDTIGRDLDRALIPRGAKTA